MRPTSSKQSQSVCVNGNGKARTLTGLEFVEANERSDGGCPEAPLGDRAHDGELALMEVVCKDAVKANVAVDDEGKGERGVNGAARAVSDGTDGDEGHQRGAQPALKCPVVRAVCSRGGRERRGVVDGALDVGCGGVR